MREPRAFAELETKIGQEEKPAQKPAEPKKQSQNYEIPHLSKVQDFLQKNPEYKTQGISEFKYDDGSSVLTGDIYKDDKRVARLEFDKSGKPINQHGQSFSNIDFSMGKQSEAQKKIDADKGSYKVVPDFKFPFEQGYDEDYERSYGPGADADDIDQELTYSKDLYEGKSDDEVIATLSQRLNTHPEKIKKLWDEREATYKEAVAQFPRLEKVLAETYPEGTDEYKTFDSQSLLHFMYDALPKPLGDDQLDKVEKEFAKYLYSKGYKDVSNNPIVEYGEQREGNQLQDELQGLVADLKATSQAQKEPLEYDERFLEDATGYLTKSLDEQGKAEINRQFKEMLDKAGFKNITPGTEAVESANAKQSSLSQYFGGEQYKPTDWDKDVFTNAAGEEYYVATPEEARERAKEEVRAFIDDQGVQGFSDQFKDWALASAVNDDFLKRLRDEEVDYYRGEGEAETADSIANMSDEDLLQYYIDSLGENEFFDIINKNNGWDIDYIIEKAIEWDGVAHFLAYYDGDEIELPNGLYAYRLN